MVCYGRVGSRESGVGGRELRERKVAEGAKNNYQLPIPNYQQQ
ncbi:hypothetical protein [Chroococcidiopsis sp.]